MRNAMSLTVFAVVVGGLTLQAQRGGTSQSTADLILTNGRIVTVDDGRPEARAMAVVGDRIEALGTADEIAKLGGPGTKVVDLHGQLAIPGFIESHGHFT